MVAEDTLCGSPRQFAASPTVMIRPLLLKPQWMCHHARSWRIGPLGRGTPAQSARRGLLHLRISGQRQAVTELRERGYDARALVGGTSAWHAIGGNTVPLDTSTYEEVEHLEQRKPI